MVKHIVMWNLAPVDPRSKSERIREIRAECARLLASIPGVESIDILENYKEGGRDLALVAEMADRAAEVAYQVHPQHVEFKAFIGPKVSDRVMLDAGE